tara:strand:- start:91 stop:576 length:486 start_codon:yes stop_codon:yes gene_type:complete
MKKVLGFLAAFAMLVLFVAPSYAQDRGGTIRRATGNTFSLGSGLSDTTTYDVWSIGFMANWVRLCALPSTDVKRVYIRLSEAATSVIGSASPTVAPVSQSSAFIAGSNNEVTERAMPFAVPVSPGATVAIEDMRCTTQPWRTRGLVIHNVSGTATIDAWAW